LPLSKKIPRPRKPWHSLAYKNLETAEKGKNEEKPLPVFLGRR